MSDPVAPGRRRDWFDHPLTAAERLVGWALIAAAHVGIVALLGGPTEGDVAESFYATVAIAHGQLACAYPPYVAMHVPVVAVPFTSTAPLYPLVAGVVAALLHLGARVPFPSAAALGPGCAHGYPAIFAWSENAAVIKHALMLGYLGSLVFLVGLVVALGATRAARTRREVVAGAVAATLLPILASLVQFFHPEDLLSLGLALIALGLTPRRRWFAAGVLVGLAVLAQQSALLVALPLLVVAPRAGRARLVLGAALSGIVVTTPFLWSGGGRALHGIVVGSGYSSTYGGTWLWELTKHGPLYFALLRIAPLAVALAVAAYARRRLGDRVREPEVLLSLVGVALAFRLVFEQNIRPYYLADLAVVLVIVLAAGRRVRGPAVAWIAFVTISFDFLPASISFTLPPWAYHVAPYANATMAGVGLAILAVWSVVRRKLEWYWALWAVLIVLGFVHLPGLQPLWEHPWPTWLRQLLVVSTGLYLVGGPLWGALGQARTPAEPDLVAS